MIQKVLVRASLVTALALSSVDAWSQARCGGTRLETLPGQSLSEIVSTYVNEQCPLNTLMWATYQANPHAFYGTIHHLRADTVLELPTFLAPDESQRLDANRQIASQREIFERYRRLVAQGVPKFRARQIASGSPAAGEQASVMPKAKTAPDGGEQLKLAPVKPDPGNAAAGSEQALMNELALREAQARIQILEQQLADLKRLLEQREQLQSASTSSASQNTKAGVSAAKQMALPASSAEPSSVGSLASNAEMPASVGGSPPPSERVAPAWLRTTEGLVLSSLLLTALLAGFILLWRMRTPMSPAASSDDQTWPPELRQARDAINRAAGRDAGLQGPSELEKAVDGRFPLPNLDFVQGVRDNEKPKRNET